MSKIRTDFVTNSSSSSFVIGLKDSDYTVESVYKIIRNLYLEMYKKIKEAVDWINMNPNGGVKYTLEDYGRDVVYIEFACTRGDFWNRRGAEVAADFEKRFGITIFTCAQYVKPEWLNCKTYKEYVEYWMKIHKANHNSGKYGPFTIYSFEDGVVEHWSHFPAYEDFVGPDELNAKIDYDSSILRWYFPTIDEALDHPDNCDGCHELMWCSGREKDACLKLKERIKNEHPDKNKACLHFLGKICVESECGYIPDYVTNRLSDIAEYSCVHMG